MTITTFSFGRIEEIEVEPVRYIFVNRKRPLKIHL